MTSQGPPKIVQIHMRHPVHKHFLSNQQILKKHFLSGTYLSLITCANALMALPLDAGIICTRDLWEIRNTLLIICDLLRSSSHDIIGYFLPATCN